MSVMNNSTVNVHDTVYVEKCSAIKYSFAANVFQHFSVLNSKC